MKNNRLFSKAALHRWGLGATLLAVSLAWSGTPSAEGDEIVVIVNVDSNVRNIDKGDLERIGGVSGWRSAAALAAERKVKMSSHLYPETSAHLLAVTPTAHFLEYMDWADKIVQEPLKIVDGHAIIPDRPGHGIVWDKAAVERYRV